MQTNPLVLSLLFAFCTFLTRTTAQWTSVPTGTTTKYESVHFFDSQHGIAGSNGKVIITYDGGQSWTAYNVPGLRDLDFVNTQVGYAAGVVGSSLKKTVNGGQTWTALPPINSNSLWGVSVVDVNTVYVCGVARTVWKSTNGGLSFSAVNLPSGTTDLVVDIHFADANTGVALGETGGVWKTTNGGALWTKTFNLPGVVFQDMYFVDAEVGFAVGSGGGIIKTVDGGSSWTALTSGVGGILEYVHFYDRLNGIVAGYGGLILRTTDGGDHWFQENAGITDNLFCCILLSPDVALVGGENGVMFRNAHLTSAVDELERELGVLVSPNPGTGVFRVETDTPILQADVLDGAGRLVRTESGIKETAWNVDLSGHPAGRYWVRLRTENAVQFATFVLGTTP